MVEVTDIRHIDDEEERRVMRRKVLESLRPTVKQAERLTGASLEELERRIVSGELGEESLPIVVGVADKLLKMMKELEEREDRKGDLDTAEILRRIVGRESNRLY